MKHTNYLDQYQIPTEAIWAYLFNSNNNFGAPHHKASVSPWLNGLRFSCLDYNWALTSSASKFQEQLDRVVEVFAFGLLKFRLMRSVVSLMTILLGSSSVLVMRSGLLSLSSMFKPRFNNTDLVSSGVLADFSDRLLQCFLIKINSQYHIPTTDSRRFTLLSPNCVVDLSHWPKLSKRPKMSSSWIL